MNADMEQLFTEALAEAKAQIAKEIREEMRRGLPVFLKRLARVSRENSHKGRVIGAIVGALREDRKQAAEFCLTQIANEHLRRSMLEDIAKESELQIALHGRVNVSAVTDTILQACALVIECYPAIAKPELPRRCDVARAIHRYLKGPTSRRAKQLVARAVQMAGEKP